MREPIISDLSHLDLLYRKNASLQFPRIHLQRLEKCLDQKVRQQTTNSSLLVVSVT